MIEKLDMKTPDFTNENIAQIAALFPNCVTEMKDNKGNTKKVIDFDLLKQELSENIVDGVKERYSLTWPGKKEALVTANKPINKTLRPDVKDSVNFDTTQNLYIEGDNLEALKLLQESYLNKIKMIYIDPPYNTGKDFVYKDNFTGDKDLELEKSGQISEEGRLVANLESNGRYHSDWLSMMYPRLKLARNLLKEDGVIFISIDDNELDNSKKLCDEIFGEDNFITIVTREAIKGGSVSKHIRVTHDYVLIYSKYIENVDFSGYEKEEIELTSEDEIGKYVKGRELNKWGAGSRREDSPSMWFPIIGPNNEEVYPIRNDGSEGRWRLGKVKMKYLAENNGIIFEKRDDGTYIAYEKIRERKAGIKQFTSIFKDNYINAKGTDRIKKIFDSERSYFDFAKPVELMYDLIIMANLEENDIVLDFFSGSGATADSVIQFNNDFERKIRFILVQINELTNENSIAYNKGYLNIPQLAKERIKKSAEKILRESTNSNLDIGFRVLKIDSSNMNDVYYSPDEITQDSLFDITVDNIKEGRNSLDLLFQVLLDSGIDLTLPIRSDKILDKEVFFIDENVLVACFEDSINEALVTEIAKMDDILKVVFKDSSFKSDDMRINVEQIFKQYSPDTDLKVI